MGGVSYGGNLRPGERRRPPLDAQLDLRGILPQHLAFHPIPVL